VYYVILLPANRFLGLTTIFEQNSFKYIPYINAHIIFYTVHLKVIRGEEGRTVKKNKLNKFLTKDVVNSIFVNTKIQKIPRLF